MASIVSKLARAAFATRASPLATVGGHPAAAIRAYPAGGPKPDVAEEMRAGPNPEAAPTISYKPHLPDDQVKKIYLPVDENALKSDEAMWAFYECWCKHLSISRDRREMERRFEIFSDTARRVHRCNIALCGRGARGRVAMTKFADWTKEEKARLLPQRFLI